VDWTLRLNTDPAQIIGSIGLKRSDDENRGFWLGLPWHGRGLMTERADAVTDFWFEQLKFPVLRVPKAVANTASRRISEKQGMRVIAVVERDYVSGRADRGNLGDHGCRMAPAASQIAARCVFRTDAARPRRVALDGRASRPPEKRNGAPDRSFKVRGAIYALSANLARGPLREVIAASTGNHGAAVAYAGQRLGVQVRIFLPANPNPVKATRIRGLGATPCAKGAPISPRPSTRPTNMRAALGAFFRTMPPTRTSRSARPRSARSWSISIAGGRCR
jgi:hypothetical protein